MSTYDEALAALAKLKPPRLSAPSQATYLQPIPTVTDELRDQILRLRSENDHLRSEYAALRARHQTLLDKLKALTDRLQSLSA